MPTTTTMTLYKFKELAPEARERAVQDAREAEAELFDADDFKDNVLCEPAAYHHRVKTAECNFSLNYCQGDGVAFYGAFDLDFFMAPVKSGDGPPGGGELAADRRAIQALVRKLTRADVTLHVKVDKINPRYDHYNSMQVAVEADNVRTAKQEAMVEQVQKLLDQYMTDVSHAVEKIGYEELDYRSSDEVIVENLEDQDTDYTVDGKVWVEPRPRRKKK